MRPKAKVLIVDDHPDILALLRTNLESAGFETVQALNGRVALERIDREAPDLVLLDLMMPVLDGWGVLEALKERGNRPPVIVVSALESAESMQRADRLDVAGYVTKPFNVTELLDLIESVLGSSGPKPSRGKARSSRSSA